MFNRTPPRAKIVLRRNTAGRQTGRKRACIKEIAGQEEQVEKTGERCKEEEEEEEMGKKDERRGERRSLNWLQFLLVPSL